MDIDTGLVEVTAGHRPPGRAAKCAVCRGLVKGGDPCVTIRGQRNAASKFYMHPGCTGRVMVKLMAAFNHINNGGGVGRELVTTSRPLRHGLFEDVSTKEA